MYLLRVCLNAPLGDEEPQELSHLNVEGTLFGVKLYPLCSEVSEDLLDGSFL